jgi:hypothetical protein
MNAKKNLILFLRRHYQYCQRLLSSSTTGLSIVMYPKRLAWPELSFDAFLDEDEQLRPPPTASVSALTGSTAWDDRHLEFSMRPNELEHERRGSYTGVFTCVLTAICCLIVSPCSRRCFHFYSRFVDHALGPVSLSTIYSALRSANPFIPPPTVSSSFPLSRCSGTAFYQQCTVLSWTVAARGLRRLPACVNGARARRETRAVREPRAVGAPRIVRAGSLHEPED